MIHSKSENVFQVFNYIFMIVISLLMLYPFWELIRISISTPAEASRMGLVLWPKELSFDSYSHVFRNQYMWLGYKNTIIRVLLGVSIQLTATTLFAYPLSKRNLPFRNIITMLVVFTMFFTGGLIPDFLLIKSLGMNNTILALVLPTGINTFQMLIMRNFFMSLPVELEESAKIDGAGHLRTLTNIVLPLSMPIIATVGLWGIVGHWNAWFDCLIYISDTKKYVLQTILRKIILEAVNTFEGHDLDYGMERVATETIRAASIIVGTLPILCVYPFVQKYFVKGIMVGSLKG